jgi:ADP-heptose:LPS heptosyltransferase
MGKTVSETVQKMRLALCHTCDEKEQGTETRLFRRINKKEYCGEPRLNSLTKVYRDEKKTGCGCNVREKALYDQSVCPRARWGPGNNIGRQFKVQIRHSEVLKDVIDVQLHYARTNEEELDMTGIGDTVACLPVVHAIQQKYPSKQVRIRAVPNRVPWAKLGWANVMSTDDWSSRGEWLIKLCPERMGLIDDICAKEHNPPISRHHLWCMAAGVDEPVRDIRLRPSNDVAEWSRGQLTEGVTNGKPIVAIVPFSNSPQRTWSMHHWIDLAGMLTKLGCFVYVVDGNEPDRTKHMPYLRYWGWGADHTVALFTKTNLVIGNDSGMSHLAGVMRVPTIAICSATDGKVVFGWYDTVKILQSPGECSPCNWQAEHGYRPSCDHQCEAMWDMKPEVVFGHAVRALKEAERRMGR